MYLLTSSNLKTFWLLINNLENLPYHQRPRELALTILQERRIRGDYIEVYKIIEGINNILDMEKLLPKSLDDGRIRGHNKRLFKRRCNTTRRLNFFK